MTKSERKKTENKKNKDTKTDGEARTNHKFNQNQFLPEVGKFVGLALQQEIDAVNKAVLNLCMTAARLGESEPLAPAILGISREALDELAGLGRADILLAQAHGLPLVELRVKDAKTLKAVLNSGFGSQEAISVITRAMPLELIEKAGKRRGGA